MNDDNQNNQNNSEMAQYMKDLAKKQAKAKRKKAEEIVNKKRADVRNQSRTDAMGESYEHETYGAKDGKKVEETPYSSLQRGFGARGNGGGNSRSGVASGAAVKGSNSLKRW